MIRNNCSQYHVCLIVCCHCCFPLVHNQTCLDEEEEEKLDYEAADSVIVSTSVEEVDELLVEPTTSQSAEVTQEAGEVDSTPETTSSQVWPLDNTFSMSTYSICALSTAFLSFTF